MIEVQTMSGGYSDWWGFEQSLAVYGKMFARLVDESSEQRNTCKSRCRPLERSSSCTEATRRDYRCSFVTVSDYSFSVWGPHCLCLIFILSPYGVGVHRKIFGNTEDLQSRLSKFEWLLHNLDLARCLKHSTYSVHSRYQTVQTRNPAFATYYSATPSSSPIMNQLPQIQ